MALGTGKFDYRLCHPDARPTPTWSERSFRSVHEAGHRSIALLNPANTPTWKQG